ncbi:MAG TPA: lipoyl(octanoyl) transferase LipB [Thermoanaerobaculia bacterium]|nr:lipoyl(octanoyl) transferase LipB [Thermoanaerobaculia bacterium]
MSRTCEVRSLHRVTYENGMQIQEAFVDLRQRDEVPDQLFLLEHPPVITLGRGGRAANLLSPIEALEADGVRYYETTRGGDITWHGPGQIVGYPIIHLGEGRRDVRKYVTRLEEVLIRTARDFGVEAARIEGKRGIWVGIEKLAAIGVRIARWVTSHGFAFNIDSDLAHYRHITPCGIEGMGVTSLSRLTRTSISRETVIASMTRHFAELFEREIVTLDHDLMVAKAILHDGGRLLLLHRRPDCGGFWQPVTGAIDAGEDPLAAARREIKEETGQNVEPEPLDLRQSFIIDPASMRSAGRLPLFADETSFLARADSRASLAIDTEEHDDWRWFTFQEAYEKIRWTDDRDAIERAGRLLEQRRRTDRPIMSDIA